MQIISSTISTFAIYASKAATRNPASDTSVASGATDDSNPGVETVDFTDMTRQQLFGWMNTQLKNGKMTFDQSTAFLGMTMKVDVATGQPGDMAADNTVCNFLDRAQQGLEGARSRHDDNEVKTLAQAIAIMQRDQGSITKVDLTA